MNKGVNPFASPTTIESSPREAGPRGFGQLPAGLAMVFYASLAASVAPVVTAPLGIRLQIAQGIVIAASLVRLAGQVLSASVDLGSAARVAAYTSTVFQVMSIVSRVLFLLRVPVFLEYSATAGFNVLFQLSNALADISLAVFACFVYLASKRALNIGLAAPVGFYACWVLLASETLMLVGFVLGGITFASNPDGYSPGMFVTLVALGGIGVGAGFVLLMIAIFRLRRALLASS